MLAPGSEDFDEKRYIINEDPSFMSKIVTDQTAVDQKLAKLQLDADADAQKKLATSLNLPFSEFSGKPIDPESLELIPKENAIESKMACVYRNGAKLIIAAYNPALESFQAVINNLKSRGFGPNIVITTNKSLSDIWSRYPASGQGHAFKVGSIEIDEAELENLEKQIGSVSDLRDKVIQIPITKLLDIMVAGALKIGASDIHFEPEANDVRLRYRIDGVLQDIVTIEKETYAKVLTRVKVLSKLKINITSSPQDGRFTIKEKSVAIEVRTSVLPSEYGETIVLRLLDPRSIKGKLEDLGMRPELLKTVREQIEKPNGAILTTGPTGSGKTTALYAFLNAINVSGTKIITIEDPIEYHVGGISQTQVEPSKGYTFSNGLRAIVRQDPDVILVGEIRDSETAEIALHAALTGHLVFSTLHTNDAAGAIPRLIDLGVKPQAIAPAITMVMAQRLVRRLCPRCKTKQALGKERVDRVKQSLSNIASKFNVPDISESTEVFFPSKCKECNETGYKGRIGVFEAFVMTTDIEKLIIDGVTNTNIQNTAVSQGMVTMIQDAYLKMIEGTTSIEEIERILGI